MANMHIQKKLVKTTISFANSTKISQFIEF